MENYRYRKATDINREYPLFELVNNAGEIMFDIGLSDVGEIEIAFNDQISNQIFNINQIETWINEGKTLVLDDFNSSP